MTSREDLQALLERVEAATGPDRVLDFELHIALVEDEAWPATNMRGVVTNPNSRMSDYLAAYRDVINADDQDFTFDRYTASLDAALALVERVLPGEWIDLTGPRKYLNIPTPVPNHWRAACRCIGWGATPALALLAALLRALAQQDEPGHE